MSSKTKKRPVDVSKGFRPTQEAEPLEAVNPCDFRQIERHITEGSAWYILTVTPGTEFKTVAHLARLRRPIFAATPIRTEWRRWTKFDNERSPRQFAALPGYVMVALPDDTPTDWIAIRNAPAVTGAVTGMMTDNPARMTPFHVRAFTYYLTTDPPDIEQFVPAPLAFEEGDQVLIADPRSPFNDVAVKALSIAGARTKVLMDLFNGPQVVEVSTSSLSRVAH